MSDWTKHCIWLVAMGLLLTVHQLSAEVIPFENWTFFMNTRVALSNYTDSEPLTNFVNVKQDAIVLNNPAFGLRAYGGCINPRSGKLRLSFTTSPSGSGESNGEVDIAIYGYHFREDNCNGKTGDLFCKRSFSVAGRKMQMFEFDITDEQLKCKSCDEQIPTLRFFITIRLQNKSNGISFENFNISYASPITFWGKKQVAGQMWLVDELAKDKEKDAKRAVLQQEALKPSISTTAPKDFSSASPASRVERAEVPIAIGDFIAEIEADMPALFDAYIEDAQLTFEKNPSNGSQKITMHLNPPPIAENFEYIVVLDRKAWNWSKGIFDKDGRPLNKDSGYLEDGTLIMRLPANCRRIDFESRGKEKQNCRIKRVFYREKKGRR